VVKEKVLGLKIPVYYVLLMQIFNSIYYLLKVLAGFLFFYSSLCDNVVEELTTTGILHNEV
jgi:hypothetical protein